MHALLDLCVRLFIHSCIYSFVTISIMYRCSVLSTLGDEQRDDQIDVAQLPRHLPLQVLAVQQVGGRGDR